MRGSRWPKWGKMSMHGSPEVPSVLKVASYSIIDDILSPRAFNSRNFLSFV
jgi:hypothetical protein